MKQTAGQSRANQFKYDFMAISKVEKVGRMTGDESSAEPMVWPEYLEWFTVKCPSYHRYLSRCFFCYHCRGLSNSLIFLFTKDWNMKEQNESGPMTLRQRM